MLAGIPRFMIHLSFPIIDFLEILYELLAKDDIDSPAKFAVAWFARAVGDKPKFDSWCWNLKCDTIAK